MVPNLAPRRKRRLSFLDGSRAWPMLASMRDPRPRTPEALTATRTLRWSDGESTGGYHAVDVGPDGLTWFDWSHVHGEGRIERGHQTLSAFLADGPLFPPPPSVLRQLTTAARALAD
jgi:hypothetical protein